MLDTIADGLRQNGVLPLYRYVLTGYVRSTSFLRATYALVTELKALGAIHICDPVMGDEGKLYVPQELVATYQSMIEGAYMITPNQFELSLLSNSEVKTKSDIFQACNALHLRGIKHVVVTSTSLAENDQAVGEAVVEVEGEEGLEHKQKQKFISVLASQLLDGVAEGAGKIRRYEIRFPELPHHFTGTGDLFASFMLARHNLYPHEDAFSSNLEWVLNAIQAILRYTMEHRSPRDPQMELNLIGAKDSILNSQTIFSVMDVTDME